MSEITLNVTDTDGAGHTLTAQPGDVLMHVLRDNISLDIGVCGGEISCGTCMVRLDPDWSQSLAGPGDDEAEMLEALDAPGGARLGCQVIVGDNLQRGAVALLHED